MFKSIISNIQSFGKKVVSKIVAFVGGIFGVKPQVVESAVPPQVAEQVADNKTEVQIEEKEGFFGKAFKAAKKVVKTTIKAVVNTAVITAIIGSELVAGLAIGYGIGFALGYFGILSLAVALIQTAIQTAGIALVASCGLVGLALLGALNVSVLLTTLVWHVLLKHLHNFLWSLVIQEPKMVPQKIYDPNFTTEMAVHAINHRANNPVMGTPEPLIEIEEEVKPITPVAEVVVDTRPATTEVKPEIVPVVIEIEEIAPEVVDIRPTPTPIKLKLNNAKELKEQLLVEIEETKIDSILMSYMASDLKKMIKALNQFISDGLNKGITRSDKKTILVSEIKKQLEYFKKAAVAA